MSTELQKYGGVPQESGPLIDALLTLFGDVIKEREEYYSTHPAPSRREIDSFVSSYGNENAAIAFGLNLIPGPWGMAASIPEIIMIMRNQLRMIYDIGMANGHKQAVLTQELLLGLAFSATGSFGGGLVIMQGSKVLVKRASLRVFQKIVIQLGGKVTQRLLRSMVAKWLPIVGAGAMAAWAKYSTSSIANDAKNVLSKEIVVEDQEEKRAPANIPELPENLSFAAEIEKIKILISMMKVDRVSDERKLEFIKPFIMNSSLSPDEREDLFKKLEKTEPLDINYRVFENNPDSSISLIMDLIGLACADEKITKAELLFMKQIAKRLNISERDFEELIEEMKENLKK